MIKEKNNLKLLIGEPEVPTGLVHLLYTTQHDTGKLEMHVLGGMDFQTLPECGKSAFFQTSYFIYFVI